jgi:hypothetical protein
MSQGYLYSPHVARVTPEPWTLHTSVPRYALQAPWLYVLGLKEAGTDAAGANRKQTRTSKSCLRQGASRGQDLPWLTSRARATLGPARQYRLAPTDCEAASCIPQDPGLLSCAPGPHMAAQGYREKAERWNRPHGHMPP